MSDVVIIWWHDRGCSKAVMGRSLRCLVLGLRHVRPAAKEQLGTTTSGGEKVGGGPGAAGAL